MTWYWYVATNKELFIDVDKFEKCRNHIQERLNGAIAFQKLFVEGVESMASNTVGHQHIILSLRYPLDDMERFAWEIIFHGDIYRGCCNIMRSVNRVNSPDVLIRTNPFVRRRADMTCTCPEKHKAKIMETCPAAKILRGEYRAKGFFGKPSKEIKIKI